MKYCVFLFSILGSCVLDLSVLETQTLSCESSEDCPKEFVCRNSIQRCVKAEQNSPAPTLLFEQYTPATAGPQTFVEFNFELSTSLARIPTARIIIEGSETTVDVVSLNVEKTRFRASFETAQSVINQETTLANLQLQIIDVFGNERSLEASPLPLDYLPPSIDNLSWADGLEEIGPQGSAIFEAVLESGAKLQSVSLRSETDTDIASLQPALLPDNSGVSPRLRMVGTIFAENVLNAGENTAKIELVVADAAGNTTIAQSPILNIDTTAPQTNLDTTPSATSNRMRAAFEFSSPDADVASFECSLDGAIPTPCTSPFLQVLSNEGEHQFSVYAIDSVGLADESPASWTWTEKRGWSLGISVAAAVASDGTLWAWGNNQSGQVGVGYIGSEVLDPIQIGTDNDWQTIERSFSASCAIKTDGSLWCFGTGALGTGTLVQSLPTRILESGPWKHVALGTENTCAIKEEGSLWCWGENSNGELANGIEDIRSDVPVRIGTQSTWVDVSVGNSAVCGIQDSGLGQRTSYCWGNTTKGDAGTPFGTKFYSPQEVLSAVDWKVIQVGNQLTCGIDALDALWCWGAINTLDDGSSFSEPAPILFDGIHAWQNLISASTYMCGLQEDSRAYCFGQLGRGFTPDKQRRSTLSPTAVLGTQQFKTIAVAARSGGSICGLDESDSLFCRGNSTSGNLGAQAPQKTLIDTSTPWASVSAGGSNTCAIDNTRGLYCFGSAGDGIFLSDIEALDTPVSVTNNVWAVTSSTQNMCVIQGSPANRRLFCWGRDIIAGFDYSVPPNLMDSNGDWLSITLGYTSFGLGSICGIRNDGGARTLWCFGDNNYGQLGLNDEIDRASPEQVGVGEAFESDWQDISAGQDHMCGIRAPGTLWCWGRGSQGRLGNGEIFGDEMLPVQIGSQNDWYKIAADDDGACGLRGDGTSGELWCWGGNGSGSVGNGTFDTQITPLQIGSASDWTDITARDRHRCAQRAGLGTWCWGENGSAEVSPEFLESQILEPTQISMPENASSISVGRSHTCAVGDGKIWCWGENSSGQRGDGQAWGPVTLEGP